MISPAAAARQIVKDFGEGASTLAAKTKDKFGRNLQLIEQTDPRAAELLAGSGSAEQTARVKIGELVRMAKRSGLEPDEAIGGLIDSQLRGMKELYEQRAAELREIDPDAIGELINDGLDRDIQRLRPADQAIVDQVKKMPPEDQQAYLVRSFESAANQIKIDPVFDELRQTPNYQQFLDYYKSNVGDKLYQYHTESGGDVLTHLGPDNTYFPLSPVTPRQSLGNYVKSKFLPGTARAKLRTGMGTEYDTTAAPLVNAVSQIIRRDSIDAAMDKLIDAGVVEKVGAKRASPDEMMFNGAVEKSHIEDLGNGNRLAMPQSIYQELAPILEVRKQTNSFFRDTTDLITSAQMLGPVDPIFHAANVVSGLVMRSPAVAYGLTKAALADARVKPMFAAFMESLSTDPFSPKNLPVLERMLEGGQVQPRWGRESYWKAGAELTGGKTVWRAIKENPLNVTHIMGPLLNGPKGLDIRVRVALEKAIEAYAPEATWAQRHAMTSTIGDYNRATQPGLIAGLKSTGLSPFATAGYTFNKLGAQTLSPFPGVPGGGAGMRLASGLTSAPAFFGLWWLTHLAITGMTPTEAKSDLFTIPLVGPVGEAIKNSGLGQFAGLDKNGTKLSMNYMYSLPARGARVFGLQSGYNDTFGSRNRFLGGKPKQGGDIASDMLRESVNTNLHPIMGPTPRLAFNLLGRDPYLSADQKTGEWNFKSTIPKGTPRGKVPIEMLKSGTIGVNPMVSRFYSHGVDKSGNGPNWMQKFIDLLTPRLIQRPYSRMSYGEKREVSQ